MKEFLKKAKKNIIKKEIAEFFREYVDEYSMLLRPKAISENLTFAELTNDFITDGYKILRNSDITSIGFSDENDNLKFLNMIYERENIFSPLNYDLDISSWETVFKKLKEDSIVATVECNLEDAIDFYIGRVTEINKNIITMRCFDGCGVVFKDDVKVNMNFVSSVSFGDRYTSVMSKYVDL